MVQERSHRAAPRSRVSRAIPGGAQWVCAVAGSQGRWISFPGVFFGAEGMGGSVFVSRWLSQPGWVGSGGVIKCKLTWFLLKSGCLFMCVVFVGRGIAKKKQVGPR